jgi:UDP-glucose 4-epimerase
MKQRYLITGGAGFIGSHLAQKIIDGGHGVYVLDDESTGSRANVTALMDSPDFHFIHGSIMDDDTLARLVGTCHFVVHLAAAVGVKYILDHPLASIMTNVAGTERVLHYCARYEKPLFLASSSEVYGLQTKAPLKEDDFCILGATSVSRWSYACSKALDEFMALAYHHKKSFPVVIARLFNTVGPRQSPAYGMVLPRLVDQALRGEPMTVYGDGRQTRTFTHVCDVVEAIFRLIGSSAAWGEVYNIGGTEEIAIGELARRIGQAAQSRSEIQFIAYEKVYNHNFQDMPRRVPDISKLMRATNFSPKIGLEQIIADVISDRKAQRAGQSGTTTSGE